MRFNITVLSLAATACLGALTAFAATRAAALRAPGADPAAPAAFHHPGVLNSQAELNLMKAKVNAGAQPWKAGWDKMREWEGASLSYKHQAYASVKSYDCDKGFSVRHFKNDSSAAYSHALQWVVTGKEEHAAKARAILTDWAKTNTSLVTDVCPTGKYNNRLSHVLESQQHAYIYCAAAEILHSTYPGWSQDDTAVFSSWLDKTLYPVVAATPTCKEGTRNVQCLDYKGEKVYVGRPVMGNGPAGAAMMAIGVFTDDRAKYEAGKAFWEENTRRYINPSDDPHPGMLGEICRGKTPAGDKKHSEMGIIQLVLGAEIAHQQGDDLYDYLDNRVALGLEYLAALYGGEKRSAWCFPQITPDTSDKPGGSPAVPGWAMAYNHYKNRRGMELPWTKKMVERTTPEPNRWDYIGWTTLTHSQGNDARPASGGQ